MRCHKIIYFIVWRLWRPQHPGYTLKEKSTKGFKKNDTITIASHLLFVFILIYVYIFFLTSSQISKHCFKQLITHCWNGKYFYSF